MRIRQCSLKLRNKVLEVVQVWGPLNKALEPMENRESLGQVRQSKLTEMLLWESRVRCHYQDVWDVVVNQTVRSKQLTRGTAAYSTT